MIMQRALTGQRSAALCLVGWLLFNYPLLSLFNGAGTWFGIPLLYAYLFAVWMLFIVLLALIAEKNPFRKSSSAEGASAPPEKD
jgi:hypothetical protein